MIYWIRRIASLLGVLAFFILFFTSLLGSRSFALEALVVALIQAFVGAALFWLLGIVVADILLKGIVTDLVTDREYLLEGGLLQQIHAMQENSSPGVTGEQAGSAGKTGKHSDER